MRCIIIDDDATSRLVLKQLCSKVKKLNLIAEFSNAIDGIKYLNTNKVDLIFLDIHMPNFSGFDFINTVKDPPNIILTTSDRYFAIDAFEYHCVIDYIVKPITMDRFEKTIAKLEKLQHKTSATSAQVSSNSANEMYVNVDRRLVKINIPEIDIIEAKGDYIKIKTETGNHIVHSTLKNIQSKLPDATFFKTHRSYIINLHKIVDIKDNSVLIKKDVIPVSRQNKNELIERLNLL
ncbi:MAG: response regulator transcription factor [Flavobacteriaceae bacterium]|nr:response regulator transcription factor [Flavobacteriaceae bacterium]